ncbi:MAG: hypothetical protein IE931_08150 [Sphingobacteriales bacterium]|nr:hypothetical protein [Sphingobacteriales bacterium]
MNINYIIAFLCFCLLAFMLYKELLRAKKVRLVFRIIASVLTVLALAFLWFPLKYSSNQTIKQNELILLTDGTNLDSIKKQKGDLYTTDNTLLNDFKSSKIKYLPSLAYHLAAQKNINSIKILGYGLSETELKKLKSYALSFQKPALPNGIQACNWPKEIYSGEDLWVDGAYQNLTSNKIKLVLKGLGTHLDSVNIEPNGSQKFQLKAKPKQIGKSVYQLIAFKGKDTLQNESLAFKVMEKQALRFLILASTPDFEYKFLKNWLFEENYSVVFRSQISKNIFSFDYLNTPKIALKQITSQNLKAFDVLIADDAALANLTSSEIADIQNQILNNGLGLFIRSTEAKSVSKFSKGFTFKEFENQKSEQLILKYSNENLDFSPLPIKQAFYLKESIASQTLITDDAKHALVIKKISGSGKIILNSVSSTFQWMLNGKTKDYAKFWSKLLTEVTKPKEKQFGISTSPTFASSGDLITINLSQNGNQAPQLNIDDVSLKPLQNKVLPNQWQASYFSEKAGWHSLKINKNASVNFYVYQPDAWQTLKQINKINATSAFVNTPNQKVFSDKSKSNQIEKELSKWWFLFLFLMSAGYLWYEERMVS